MRLLSQQSPNRTPEVVIPKGKKNVQSIVPLPRHEQRGAKRKSQKSEIMNSSPFKNLLEKNVFLELEDAKANRALKKNKNGDKTKKGKAQKAKKKLILNSIENAVPSTSSTNNEGTICPGCEQTYDEDWIQCIAIVLYATTTKFSGRVLLASRPAYSYPPRRYKCWGHNCPHTCNMEFLKLLGHILEFIVWNAVFHLRDGFLDAPHRSFFFLM
ncbi:hypothetical protein AVEN_31049-1 [Araneus ventricosus]|uniref:Uncharacterized protein n=1 Tax=Araneus ventricosus TaxID=182803 RepID=A0A4Y2GF41_ARAVE|nr:hypothetical protein AVEN_31049-1 [Araneus ventricosus]